jgi:hypothetical protein
MTLDVSRRRLLAGSAAALAFAACSDGGPAEADADLDFAGAAAGVEKLALDHYTNTVLLMTGGKLGALVPPALGALFATTTGHHRQAHDAWNKVRTGAGRAEVTAPRAKLQEALNAASLRQFDVPAAVDLAIRIEDYACQTYQQAIPTLRGPDVLGLATRVAAAGYQRQAALRFLLGLAPGAGAGADPQHTLITG